jgi:non-ribosomal peptide synthetase component E (peptide arylation enzyme)
MEIRVVGQDEKDVTAGEIGSLQVRGMCIHGVFYPVFNVSIVM